MRRDLVTLKQLRALDAVVRYGTFSQAADVLGLTGPAVHSQLKTLEDAVGSPLLDRSGKGTPELTAQGAALLEAYAEADAALGRAMLQIEALDRGHSGTVVIGVVSTAKYFAPRLVKRLRDVLPEVEIQLRVGNRQETLAGLARHEFDLCIMGRPPRDTLPQAARLADHPHILIAAADHPLAGRDDITPDDLLSETFVMREEGSGTRILAARFLDDLGEGVLPDMVEMTSNETIKQAVLSDLGIAIISAHTVADELQSGRLVALRAQGLPILRQWFLLSPPPEKITPTVARVSEIIVDDIERILPRLDEI